MRTRLAWLIVGATAALAASCAADDDEHAGSAANGGSGDDDTHPGTAANGGSGDDAHAGAPPTGDGKATCQSFVQTLTDCEVIRGTHFKGCSDDDPTLQCLASCVADAACDEIKETYCYHSFTGYAECLQACKKPRDFVCGDGSTIAATWQCDGVADCPGGEDEECADGTFACAGGPSIPAGWRCDGVEDCSGGDDEADCHPDFRCDDGTLVPASQECDRFVDCPNGEDERDCTMLTCE